ncbi:hypothetical protein [Zhihengliuella flava]|uniref:Uncharacterized protein n=1 Tax=Zhihengliuella flava TaxID=1285193 RepID=A0A931DCS0_9MICC|nr:hypothetical protein [Zhihengliuella flava]MBG6084473.1 hypothetical protein [Zhihengliuella flava]
MDEEIRMKPERRGGVPVTLILLVVLAVVLFLTAAPHQEIWWNIVAALAVVGCSWGAIADSSAKAKKLRQAKGPK